MARASTRLDGITAPVDSGFSIQERMNCTSSSRRRLFFSTRAYECEVIDAGSRVQAAGLAATFTGIGSKAGGQDGSTRLATTASKAVKKLFDSTEETSRFRLVFFRRKLFELSQQFTLTFGQVLRRFHRNLNVHIASLFRTQHRHTFACQPETASGLRPPRDLDPHLAAVNRWYFKFSAQGRADHGDRHPTMQVGTVALKEFVRRHFQKNIKVASRATPQARLAFTRQPNAGAILDAGRNIDRKRALARHAPAAAA